MTSDTSCGWFAVMSMILPMPYLALTRLNVLTAIRSRSDTSFAARVIFAYTASSRLICACAARRSTSSPAALAAMAMSFW